MSGFLDNDILQLCALVINELDGIEDLTINQQHMESLAYKVRQAEEMKFWEI